MIRSGDTFRPGTRAVRCCATIALLALMLAQTGCDELYYGFVASFVCTLGGAGDCTAERLAFALSEYETAQFRCQYYKRQCDQLCGLAQQAVELVAEECGNQEQQFQSSGLPGEFACHLDDDTDLRLQEAKQQVLLCRTPCANCIR